MEFIVSVQGKSEQTTTEIARECINAGATMIRTDKPIVCRVPLIGLCKIKVQNPRTMPYITPTITEVKNVANWAKYIAIDCRVENRENLENIFQYCERKKVYIVADLQKNEDYDNLQAMGLIPKYYTTALGVFGTTVPPYDLMKYLIDNGEKNKIIAEGNINSENRVSIIRKCGIDKICIGAAISDQYKLTKKYFYAMIGRSRGNYDQ